MSYPPGWPISAKYSQWGSKCLQALRFFFAGGGVGRSCLNNIMEVVLESHDVPNWPSEKVGDDLFVLDGFSAYFQLRDMSSTGSTREITVLKAWFFQAWFSSPGFPGMVFQAWFSSPGIPGMVFLAWRSRHGFPGMVFQA